MPRRKRKSQGDLETELLANGRWSGLKEQHRLEAMNHSESQNQRARELSTALRTTGLPADYLTTFEELWGLK